VSRLRSNRQRATTREFERRLDDLNLPGSSPHQQPERLEIVGARERCVLALDRCDLGFAPAHVLEGVSASGLPSR
jgi:hypothetical protein